MLCLIELNDRKGRTGIRTRNLYIKSVNRTTPARNHSRIVDITAKVPVPKARSDGVVAFVLLRIIRIAGMCVRFGKCSTN